MSYIFDALKKTEQHPLISQLTPKEETPYQKTVKKNMDSLGIWILIGLLLTINILLMITLNRSKSPLVSPVIYFLHPGQNKPPVLGQEKLLLLHQYSETQVPISEKLNNQQGT